MTDGSKSGLGPLDQRIAEARPDDVALPRAHLRARLEQLLFGETDEPARLGRFVLLERLGQGGMGVVYSAYDPELDRRVAVKILQSRRSDHARERLEREARALARLSHPNVVPVYDVGVVGDQVFVVMELVSGSTLRAWAQAAPRSVREILDVYLQAGRGLAAAHAVGLVHRDFKPDNALVGEDGRVRVLDFGLVQPSLARSEAAAPDADAAVRSLPSGDTLQAELPGDAPTSVELAADTEPSLTRTGAIMGTPAYMSPEQFASARVGPESDQWSFCVALYEALYGQHPFAGDSLDTLRANVCAGTVREAPRGARVPGWIAPLILRGLAPDPAARHRSMDALLAALGRDPAAARRRWIVATAGLALAVAAAVALTVHDGDAAACSGGRPAMDAIWGASGRARVERAMLATALPYAPRAWASVSAGLDHYAGDWARMHRQACLSHRRGEESAALLDKRMACLGRRQGALASAVAVLAEIDAGSLADAVQVVRGLPRLDVCADGSALAAAVPPPEDPDIARRVSELGRRLDRAEALEHAGRYVDARAEAGAVREQAETLGYRPLLGQALLIEGRVAVLQRDLAWAGERLERAALVALAAGLDSIGVEALARRIYAQGVLGAEHVRELVPVGEALAERITDRAMVHALLLNNAGSVELSRGDRAAAKQLFERALAARQGAAGEQPIELVNILSNVALVTADPVRRAELLQQAVAEMARALGPEHPRTLTLRVTHALYTASPTDARDILAATCALYERYHADIELELTECLYHLAQLDIELGRDADASAGFVHVAELVAAREAASESSRLLGAVALGNAQLVRREHERAHAAYAGVLAELHARGGPAPWWQERWQAEARLGLGMSAQALGRPGDAVALLEQALATFEALGTINHNMAYRRLWARALVALATALWERGDAARARELIARAEDWYRQQGAGYDARLAAIAAWRRERP